MMELDHGGMRFSAAHATELALVLIEPVPDRVPARAFHVRTALPFDVSK